MKSFGLSPCGFRASTNCLNLLPLWPLGSGGDGQLIVLVEILAQYSWEIAAVGSTCNLTTYFPDVWAMNEFGVSQGVV